MDRHIKNLGQAQKNSQYSALECYFYLNDRLLESLKALKILLGQQIKYNDYMKKQAFGQQDA
jgi:hypothetical protein